MNKQTSLLAATAFALVLATHPGCERIPVIKESLCLKGRLEVAYPCGIFTVKVLEGAVDAAWIEKEWTDSITGKVYTNVFSVNSACTFMNSDVSVGQEFYFEIDDTDIQDCVLCAAYFPKPYKGLFIRVLNYRCK